MNGCVIPHTPIAVDFWKIRNCPHARIFFLTHLHGDHITGLTSSWRFPIYCSEITKQLLVHKLGITESLINVLETGCTAIIYLDDDQTEQMSVTAIDAQHCPGAIMILMEGYFGTILHTGDFRYHPNMITSSTLAQYSGKVDLLYLDNTYCSSGCRFPPRDDAIKQIIDIIDKHPSYDILIAMRNLGKEVLLTAIARHFHEWISVSVKFYETLQILGAPDVFDCTSTQHRIRVVSFHKVSNRFVQKVNEEQPTIVIIPTALYCGIDATPYENNKQVFVVPYSDHSSHVEILEFVSFLKPGRIIPIVEAKARGPFGHSVANRADMSQFAQFVSGGYGDSVIIPASVQAFMNRGHSALSASKIGMKRKKPLHRLNAKKKSKGVAYESPDSKHAPNDENQVVVDSNMCDATKKFEFSKDNVQNLFDKAEDFNERFKNSSNDKIVTLGSERIKSVLMSKSPRTSLDRPFPLKQLTFDKALGRNTYSRSCATKKLAVDNATQESEEDKHDAKYARCLEFVNSLEPDYDVIEEEEIVWKDAPAGAKERRQRKNKRVQKFKTKNDNPHQISGNFDDEMLNPISKKKKVKSNISARNAKEAKDLVDHGKNLTLNYKAVNMNEYETIVLSDSDEPTENDLKVNGQYTGPFKQYTIAEKYFADETTSDDSGRLVIDTDSELIYLNGQNVVPENEKVVHEIAENINEDESVEISIVHDTPKKYVVSNSMNKIDNECLNDSINVQVGTQCPGYNDVEGLDVDSLNDTIANIIQDERDKKAVCKRDDKRRKNRREDIVGNNNTNATGMRDEPHADNDDRSDYSMNVNIGTQVVNETSGDDFVEESEACEHKILNESVHEQSISVINDSTGTQTFINQTFDGENEIENDDITNSDAAYVGINTGERIEHGHVETHYGDKTSKDKAHVDAVNESKQGYRTRSRLLESNESGDKKAEEGDISSDMSSLKFKPLTNSKKTSHENNSNVELSCKTQEVDISENHTPFVSSDRLIVDECTNKDLEHSKFNYDRLDELGAFIKAFEFFENINAQKQIDGSFEREKMLKAEAYKRYLAGLESDEFKKYPKYSFRVKPKTKT